MVALTWDPLSVDYLLVSNAQTGVRLIDSVSASVIMRFQLPSAASRVKTLAWINTAPGMFITGGKLHMKKFVKAIFLKIWTVLLLSESKTCMAMKSIRHEVSRVINVNCKN